MLLLREIRYFDERRDGWTNGRMLMGGLYLSVGGDFIVRSWAVAVISVVVVLREGMDDG